MYIHTYMPLLLFTYINLLTTPNYCFIGMLPSPEETTSYNFLQLLLSTIETTFYYYYLDY